MVISEVVIEQRFNVVYLNIHVLCMRLNDAKTTEAQIVQINWGFYNILQQKISGSNPSVPNSKSILIMICSRKVGSYI